MSIAAWIFLAAALAWGVLRFAKYRDRQAADQKAGVDKRARMAREDAQAMKRTLDGRR